METKATGKKKKVYTVPMQRCRQTPEMEDCFARTRAGNCSALVDTEYPCGECPFYKPPDQLEEEQKRTYERLIRMCVLGIPSLLAGLVTFIKLQVHQNRAMKLAVKAMLQDRLLQGYKHYLEKGWADLDDRKNLENVWVQYHALGGNGDMNDLRFTFRHLPMTPGGTPVVPSEEET